MLLADQPEPQPRKRRARKELHTTDIPIQQNPDIEMPADGPIQRESPVVTPVDRPLMKDQLEELAFNEEPVTILLHPSSDRNAAPVTDLIALDGKWAEILVNGKWVPWGYLPKNQPITVKRKIVEILARSKGDQVETQILDRESGYPRNVIRRVTSSKYPFSVIEDRNPKGQEWLMRIVGSQV
jgi:hypothetical protein